MRGLALIAVVWTHFGFQGQKHGYLAIETFFTLSGYLITRNLLRDGLRPTTFYLGRARRLLPALWVWLVLTALLSGLAPASEQPDGLFWVLAPLNLVPWGVVATHGWMGFLAHTWSLGVEESFYLAWPLMLMGLRRLSRAWAVRLTLAASVACFALGALLYAPRADGRIPDVYYLPPCRTGGLLLGCALAFWLHGREAPFPHWTRVVTVAGLPAVLLALAVVSDGAGSFALRSFVVSLPLADLATCSVILATYVAPRERWDRQLLSLRPLRMLGKASYSVYLWHYPVLAMTRTWAEHWHVRYAVPARVLAFLVPGIVSYLLLERPYLNRKRDEGPHSGKQSVHREAPSHDGAL